MVEKVNANKKLGEEAARELVAEVKEVYVAKGRKQLHFDVADGPPEGDELFGLMLGRTGNLRAPTMRKGEILLVGFNQAMYEEFFGAS